MTDWPSIALCMDDNGKPYLWESPYSGHGTYTALKHMPPEWIGNVTPQQWRDSEGDMDKLRPHLRTGWPHNHYYC